MSAIYGPMGRAIYGRKRPCDISARGADAIYRRCAAMRCRPGRQELSLSQPFRLTAPSSEGACVGAAKPKENGRRGGHWPPAIYGLWPCDIWPQAAMRYICPRGRCDISPQSGDALQGILYRTKSAKSVEVSTIFLCIFIISKTFVEVKKNILTR